ncbi:hypothetical protein CHS0354_010459 [Potamilus streckersoni]|uniref:EGF-like domain-containing protein n=1 Tax=Potamilus streckersoni TaxID=2493646 RepID=A0AAE0VX13_9BIVA|nr:hypothetical protein CHS0354_010459 [Potamilus streckersoni]
MKNEEALCQEKCYSNPHQCSNGGECYFDYKNETLKCRCQDTADYVYSGERCEMGYRKVQNLSLSTKDYVIIAGSAAGAVVFILVFFNLIKCLRKTKRKGKDDNDLDNGISDLNAPDVSIQMNAPLNGKYATENNAYLQESDLPKTKKDHRVYRDPHTGEEALIYQPKNITKPQSKEGRGLEYMQSEQTSRRSVYDYIDTENPYKIKRPNLNESRNWPL